MVDQPGTRYRGRTKWGVRRHDVGDKPVILVIEGYDEQAEEVARSMAAQMTEISQEKGWDNAPELVRCSLVWEATSLVESEYPPNVRCDCGELIHIDMPYVEDDPRPGVLWHGNPEGGGHSSDFDRATRRTK